MVLFAQAEELHGERRWDVCLWGRGYMGLAG